MNVIQATSGNRLRPVPYGPHLRLTVLVRSQDSFIPSGSDMPFISFTANLQRHVPCPPGSVPGATVREVLEHAFAQAPRARSYVLDEHGELRRHMVVFVNGQACSDRRGLTDPVAPEDQIVVMQALSGG